MLVSDEVKRMTLNNPTSTHWMYKLESAFNTQASSVDTSPEFIIKSSNFNVNNNASPRQGIGDGRFATSHRNGLLDIDWTMSGEFVGFSELQLGVGGKAGAGTAGDPYVIYDADEQINWGATTAFTTAKVEVGDELGGTDDVDTYGAVVMNTLEISGEIGGFLTGNFAGFARGVLSGASAQSYTANSDRSFAIGDSSTGWNWNGTDIDSVIQRFSVSRSNKLTRRRGIGDGRFVSGYKVGIVVYAVSFTAVMERSTLLSLQNDFFGATNQPTTSSVMIERELIITVSEGSGSGDRNVRINLDNVSLNVRGKPVNFGDTEVLVNFSGFATKAINSRFVEWWTVS